MSKTLANLDDLRQALDAHDTYFRARNINPRVPLDVHSIRIALPTLRRGGRRLDDPVQVSPAVIAATSN